VSATRNLGIQHARGEYVALLDCDDEWLPDKLTKQVRQLEEHPDAVLIYSKAVSVDEDGVELARSHHNFNFPHICGNALPETHDAIVTGMINDAVWMPALTVVMKTDSVRNVGGFDETLKLQVEDHLLFTLLAASGPVYMIDEVLAKYRVHKNAYTQTNPWRDSMLEYYDRLYAKLPASYPRVINSARLKLIANDLVTLQSFRNLPGSGRAIKIVAAALFDRRVLLREKGSFIFRLTYNLMMQARRYIRGYTR
jgi:glycosyltransferase involved in cell wall biosynthesis